MEATDTKTQDRVLGNGDNAMRDMRFDIRPFVCTSFETAVHNDGARTGTGGAVMRALSSRDRVRGEDVRDDNGSDIFTDGGEGTEFPAECVKGCCRGWYLYGRTEKLSELFERYESI